MATDVPEGEEHEAPKPLDGADPLGSDPAGVPLVPPGDANALPGQLETAPDGSIRPAPGGGSHQFAPPAPGLLDEPLVAAPPPQTPPLEAPAVPAPPAVDIQTASSPAWAIAEDPPAPKDEHNDAERAAWPTVAPDGAGDSPASPVPQQQATAGAGPGPGESPTPPLVQTDVSGAASQAEPPPATIVRPPEDVNAGEDMYDVPLGTLVYRSGLLGADQIESALAESERIGKRLGEVLIDNKMIDERDLGRLLAGQKGLPFLDLAQTAIEPAATELLPAASARIYCALPIAMQDGTPVVAVSDPTNGLVVEGVRRAIGGELLFAVATRSDLQRAIATNYGADENEAASDDVPEQPEQPSVAVEPVPEPPAMTPVDTPPAEPVSELPAPELTPPAASDLDVTAPAAQPPVPAPQPPTAADIAAQTAPLEQPVADLSPTPIPEEPVTPPSLSDDAIEPAPLITHGTPLVGADPQATPTPLTEPPAAAPAPTTPAVADGGSTQPSPNLTQREAGATTPVEKTVRVMIRLSDGDQVDAGAFANNDEALARAKALISSLSTASAAEWPFLSGRFLRPETIVSVDLLEERPRR